MPAVVLIAIVTLIAWALFGPQPAMVYAFVNAVAVLIIACPCVWDWPPPCRSWSGRAEVRRPAC